jgi:hypothetical protein
MCRSVGRFASDSRINYLSLPMLLGLGIAGISGITRFSFAGTAPNVPSSSWVSPRGDEGSGTQRRDLLQYKSCLQTPLHRSSQGALCSPGMKVSSFHEVMLEFHSSNCIDVCSKSAPRHAHYLHPANPLAISYSRLKSIPASCPGSKSCTPT